MNTHTGHCGSLQEQLLKPMDNIRGLLIGWPCSGKPEEFCFDRYDLCCLSDIGVWLLFYIG